MSNTRALHLLVGRALVSDRFCADLLFSRRSELVDNIGLAPEEAAQVKAIRAESLTEFAQTLDQLLRLGEA
jgi:hypothetical protein